MTDQYYAIIILIILVVILFMLFNSDGAETNDVNIMTIPLASNIIDESKYNDMIVYDKQTVLSEYDNWIRERDNLLTQNKTEPIISEPTNSMMIDNNSSNMINESFYSNIPMEHNVIESEGSQFAIHEEGCGTMTPQQYAQWMDKRMDYVTTINGMDILKYADMKKKELLKF